jgi:hypothetical protein
MLKAYKFTKNPLQQEQAQNKAGGLGQTGQGRQARSIDVPTLTVTIFAATELTLTTRYVVLAIH